jgi:hypothetical protein
MAEPAAISESVAVASALPSIRLSSPRAADDGLTGTTLKLVDGDGKREVIADQLRETPNWSLRRTAKMLGVDHTTVASVRDDLHSTGEIPQFDKTVGLDGKFRSAVDTNHERYTPAGIMDSIRKVMDQIDLDPASSPKANETVGASSYFTNETNGLNMR